MFVIILVTPISIFDLLDAKAKTGIATRAIRPTMAIVDPIVTETMNSTIAACTGFDVLSHAIESYTARPFSKRILPNGLDIKNRANWHDNRPLSQGQNPWADIGCLEALRIVGKYMERSVIDSNDIEARHQMMYAAVLAGIR